MPLAEGVQATVTYKAYASALITPNAQAVSSSDLATSGGQRLRRTVSSLSLTKDTYQSAEIRSDRQIADFRHGVKRVTGSLQGEMSCLTYADLIEAACRHTRVAPIAFSNSDFTSIAADNATSTFTATSGDPAALGIRVGHILRFLNLSDAGNNSRNFLVTSLTNASNRTIGVYPAPNTMGADSAFTGSTTGKTIFVPSSNFVSRKFGVELNNNDIDISQLFTECRIGGWNMNLPATGMGTIEFPVMGRDLEIYTGASAPFFTAPTAETTAGIEAAVNGLIKVQGLTVGVVTGINFTMNLSPSSDAVVGQNFVPEIFLGRANVTGQLTALLLDETFINYFKNETEISVLVYLTATSAINSPAVSIFMPRVKVGGANAPAQGEGGQSITLPFQALKYTANPVTTGGIENTTIQYVDTELP